MATESENEPTEGGFINADGLKMFCKYWYPEKRDIRALVLAIHGLGEHIGRYEALASTFTKLGCMVFGHDHAGHGRSEGTRVDVVDFDNYVRDCFQHVDMMVKKYPGIPMMIYGHSMGGAIAILTMNSAPERFMGAIFGSPGLKIDPNQATPFMIFMGRILSRLCPQAAIGKLDISKLSRDPAVVVSYEKDPLVWHGGIKARFAMQILSAMQRIEADSEKVTYPFLLQHGTKDCICDITGSEQFFEHAATHNKVFKRYEGYYHEITKEPEGEREIVFKDIEDWTERLLSNFAAGRTVSPTEIDVKS